MNAALSTRLIESGNQWPRRLAAVAGLLSAFVVILSGSQRAQASHPYHVSLAEVEWNAKNKSLEVALCVWPADLEKAISKIEARPVDLDKEPKLDGKIRKLITRDFVVKNAKGEKLNLEWVGHQKNLKEAWLFFEIKNVNPSDTLSFRNQLFFDLNEDQLNHLNGRFGKHSTNFTFTAAKPTHSVTVNESGR